MKAITVTGTPGTGKTKVAKLIAKQIKAKYIDVNKIIKENKLYLDYDRRLNSHNINLNKLVNILIKLIKSSKDKLVIDSHLSHYIPRRYVDKCIVTKCDLKTLKRRLQRRWYSKVKIRNNLDSEIFDICLMEAIMNKHKIKVVDTSRGINKNKIMRLLK